MCFAKARDIIILRDSGCFRIGGVNGMYFEYGDKELDFLRRKDKRLREVIDRIGHIDRTADTGLFSSVVHHIIGQQISVKAQVLSEVKGNQVEYVKVPVDSLRSYFRPDTSIKQMTETLVKAMEFYNKHLERQRRDRDAR